MKAAFAPARLGAALLLVALLFGVAGGRAGADMIYLKDGRTLEGKVVDESGDEIKVRVGLAGVVTNIKKSDVTRIVRGSSSTDAITDRFEALTPSKPLGYVETGEWCLKQKEKSLRDVGLKLLGIASRLDKGLFVRANLLLADHYLGELKDKARAGICYRRVLRIEPTNADARSKLNEVKDALASAGKEATSALSAGLQALQSNDFDAAAEQLAKAGDSPYADRVTSVAGTSLADLVKFVRAKQGCKPCSSTGGIQCPTCTGTGQVPCTVCKGKGSIPVPPPKPGQTGQPAFCRSCFGVGSLLCRKCGATRTISMPDPRAPGQQIEVVIKTGQESSVVRPGTKIWELVVAGGSLGGQVKGGTLTCNACKGKPPKVPPLEVRPEGLQSLMELLQRKLSGEATAEEQFGTKMRRIGVYEYAPEVLADDKLVFSNGAWCTLAQKKGEGSEAGGGGVEEAELAALEKGAKRFQPQSGEVEGFEADPKTLVSALLGEGGALPETASAAASSGRLRMTVFAPAAARKDAAPCSVLPQEGSQRSLALLVYEQGGAGRMVTSGAELVDAEGRAFPLPEGAPSDAGFPALAEGRAELRLWYIPVGHETRLRRVGTVDALSEVFPVQVYRAEIREKGGGKVLAVWR